MTPASTRKQQERQRRKDAGLVRCEVWVKPEHVAEVRSYAERLLKPKSASDRLLDVALGPQFYEAAMNDWYAEEQAKAKAEKPKP
jgi:hypothetical protein